MKTVNDNSLDDVPTKKMKPFHGSGCYKVKIARVKVWLNGHEVSSMLSQGLPIRGLPLCGVCDPAAFPGTAVTDRL
jgi:hypothetical protein